MNIELKDSSAHGPVYAQLREQIERQIRDRVIVSGESLPTPAVLAQQLGIDRGEVQRAYFELEYSGLVKRKVSKDFLGKAKTTYLIC